MAGYWRNTKYKLIDGDGQVQQDYYGSRDEPLMIAFQALDAVHNEDALAREALEELLGRNLDGLLTSSIEQARKKGEIHISHPYVPQMYVYTIDILQRYEMLSSKQPGRGYKSWVDGHANYYLVGGACDRSRLPFSGQTFLTIVYDPATDSSTPPRSGEYTGRAFGDAWHVAYVNAVAYWHFGDRSYLNRAVTILSACRKDYMRWSVTDDPSELEVNSVFAEVCNWYNGYGIACWLQTYWLLQVLERCPEQITQASADVLKAAADAWVM